MICSGVRRLRFMTVLSGLTAAQDSHNTWTSFRGADQIDKGASCENKDLYAAAEAYNGNDREDPNGFPRKVNYRNAAAGMFETGKFHDSKTGKQVKGGNGKDKIFTPPTDDC